MESILISTTLLTHRQADRQQHSTGGRPLGREAPGVCDAHELLLNAVFCLWHEACLGWNADLLA
jgi:hypothetical protein